MSFGLRPAPWNSGSCQTAERDSSSYLFAVAVIDNSMTMGEQTKLFLQFRFYIREVLLMSTSYIRNDTIRGAYYALQTFHFPHLRYAGLKYTESVFLRHLPYGKGYSYLRVIASGRADNAIVLAQ